MGLLPLREKGRAVKFPRTKGIFDRVFRLEGKMGFPEQMEVWGRGFRFWSKPGVGYPNQWFGQDLLLVKGGDRIIPEPPQNSVGFLGLRTGKKLSEHQGKICKDSTFWLERGQVILSELGFVAKILRIG